MEKKEHLKKLFTRLFLITIFISVWMTGCTKEVTQIVRVPKSIAKTIFFDDFSKASQSNNRNLWLSNGKAHWVWQGKTSSFPGCTDGCLKQNSESDRALNAIMYVKTPQFSNGTIETKTRMSYDLSIAMTSEELKKLRYFIGTGIVFRLVDDNNYYMFRIAGEEGCVLGKMVNGKWVDLVNPRRLSFLEGGRVKPNNWYTLKVRVVSNNIQCFINDSPVINYTDHDSGFTVGHFGLTTFKCFGDFEYLKVTR